MRCRRTWRGTAAHSLALKMGGPAGGGADGRVCPGVRRVTVWSSFLGTKVHLMLSPQKAKVCWQESVRLDGLIRRLPSDVCVVRRRSLCRWRIDQDHCQQHQAQTAGKRMRFICHLNFQ